MSNIKDLISSNVNKTNQRLDKLSSEIGEGLVQVKQEIKDLKTKVKTIQYDFLKLYYG